VEDHGRDAHATLPWRIASFSGGASRIVNVI
jgi:hypothetical protein